MSANLLIHAFLYLIYVRQCSVSFPVGFITSDALSHTILLFKSYNGKRSSVHAHVFLKTQLYVYGKKKNSYFLFNKIFLLGTITYLRISKVLLVLVI